MTEPYEHLLEAYAKLVIRLGVNVQPGQPVVIWSLPEQADVARALAEEAYRVGASRVSIDYTDPYLQRDQVRFAPESELGRVAPEKLDTVRSWRQTRPAFIRLTGNPHPQLMEGLDPDRLARSAPTELFTELRSLLGTNELAWTVVGAPTPGWAQSIGVAGVAELWNAVAVAMRLDEDDPIAAWRAHVDRLQRRRDLLNGRRFDRIRYRGPGTDLTVGVSPQSAWVAA